MKIPMDFLCNVTEEISPHSLNFGEHYNSTLAIFVVTLVGGLQSLI
jgi:hypothetical protein